MDWSNLSSSDMGTLYLVSAGIVLTLCWLVQSLVKGVAGKIASFVVFLVFMATANWAIQHNAHSSPEQIEADEKANAPIHSQEADQSYTPPADKSGPVPSSYPPQNDSTD